MRTTSHNRSDSPGKAPYWTEESRDVTALRAFLVREPEKAAMLLGDLAVHYADVTRWFVRRSVEGVDAVVMLYIGASVPSLHLYGPPEAVDFLVEQYADELPDRFELHGCPEHREIMERRYPDIAWRRYVRMKLLVEEFSGSIEMRRAQRLSHADTAALVRLYGRCDLTFFDPHQIEAGFYFGIHEGDALVSAAGVHTVSTEDMIAAIGNVATHPDCRGQGLSVLTTGRLIQELLGRRMRTIVLNVSEHNHPAIRVYRKLGFREHTEILLAHIGASAPQHM